MLLSRHTRRREFIAAFSGAASWALVARAQQPGLPVVGFLSSLSPAALTGPVAAFRRGMGSLGYEEGKNLTMEFRWAEGHYDRLPALATELVQKQAAVIVTVGGDPPAFAAKAASTTTPIVQPTSSRSKSSHARCDIPWCPLRNFGEANVRFGSKADIGRVSSDVRFVPKADISSALTVVRKDVVRHHCNDDVHWDAGEFLCSFC
jgi:hypothetical protein